MPDHLISELTGLSKLVTSPPQENVLAESRMMVPDCHKRLETALADLKATLAELKESNEQGAEIGEAESTIAEVEAVVKPAED